MISYSLQKEGAEAMRTCQLTFKDDPYRSHTSFLIDNQPEWRQGSIMMEKEGSLLVVSNLSLIVL